MKKIFILLALASSLMLTSCGGGGGTTSTGGVNYTHSQLADEFVFRLFTDLGIDVTLVKTNTLQYDYIVVYDHDLLTYDAYYIGNYNVGENLSNYLYNDDSSFYYDLDDIRHKSKTWDLGYVWVDKEREFIYLNLYWISTPDSLKPSKLHGKYKLNKGD